MFGLTAKVLNDDETFKEHFDEIYEFCKNSIIETKQEEIDTGRDLRQTLSNTAYENWETNNECLLYSIYQKHKFSNDKGALVCLYDGDRLIATSGVERYNPKVAIYGKRSYVVGEWRKKAILNGMCHTRQREWVLKYNKSAKIKIPLETITFNVYNRDNAFSTTKKFIDGTHDVPFMRGWKILPMTVDVHHVEQYVVYNFLEGNEGHTDEEVIALMKGE